MNGESEHVEFDVLNDYVDGRLDPVTVGRVEEHVRTCTQCSEELADLRALLSGVASLPREVLPGDDIWTNLRDAIEDRKHVMLPNRGFAAQANGSTLPSPHNKWRARALLAVAAIVLVVLSSSITAIVLRQNEPDFARNDTVLPRDISVAPVLPASFAVAEGGYVATIAELKSAFVAQRSRLSPETVRTVERSLAVIDTAITEARTALLADPGNRMLVDLLSASYQRKLDLLRRTSELTPRT